MDKHSGKALKIIASNRYMTIATAMSAEPWAAALAYVIDSEFNFYWYSAAASRHSRNILANPKVAVAIFDSTLSSDEVDGVQIEGHACEVREADLEWVIELYYELSFPNPEDRKRWRKPLESFVGSAPLRFYCLAPTKAFKCDLESVLVDRRITVDLIKQ